MAKNPENVYRRRFMSPIERLLDLCEYPDGPEGCWLYQGALTTGGYGQFWWKGKNNRAHRVSFQLSYGDVDEYAIIRHKCHTPRCVNPAHLEIGTHADNMWDMVNAKRAASGSLNGNSRLNEHQVGQIISRHLLENTSRAELGRAFGVSEVAINGILCGKLWRNFTGIASYEDLVNRRDFFLSRFCPPGGSAGSPGESISGTSTLWKDFDDWKGASK
jgi:hypothetical protein